MFYEVFVAYDLLITLLCETKDHAICQVLCGCLTRMIPNLNVSVYMYTYC